MRRLLILAISVAVTTPVLAAHVLVKPRFPLANSDTDVFSGSTSAAELRLTQAPTAAQIGQLMSGQLSYVLYATNAAEFSGAAANMAACGSALDAVATGLGGVVVSAQLSQGAECSGLLVVSGKKLTVRVRP